MGQTDAAGNDAGVATLSPASVGRGMFQPRVVSNQSDREVDESGVHTAITGHRAFSRSVGLKYSWQVIRYSLPLLVCDLATLAGTVFVLRLLTKLLEFQVGIDVSGSFLPIAVGFMLINFELGLYPGVRLSPVDELRRLAVSVTCVFVVWGLCVFVLAGGLGDNKWILLSALYLACLMTLPVARSWLRRILGRFTNWGIPAIVCGDDAAAVRVFHWLKDNHHLGLRPIGVVGDSETLDAGPDDDWYAGAWSDTQDVAEKRNVFWAVVVPPEDRAMSMSTLIADYLYTIPQVHVLSELTGLPDHWNPQQLDGLAGIHLQQNLMLPLPRMTKRCMDFAFSVIGGIALLPLLLLLAVWVNASSRGPIFFGHKRYGRNGRVFKAWKFRTMFQDSNLVLEKYLDENPEAREEWERDHKLRHDPRITRIGRFLRKTSLDELPQLWNVIVGDMSLVGPRPIVTEEIAKYGHYYGLYTMVKPGITGLWQVSGRNNTTYEERVQLDAYYVRNWSPWVDVFLLIKTIRIVLFAKGAY